MKYYVAGDAPPDEDDSSEEPSHEDELTIAVPAADLQDEPLDGPANAN
jgi:hypothetical protein